MIENRPPAAREIERAVAAYREMGNFAALHADLATVCENVRAVDELAAAVEPFLDIPEVAGPVYEYIVSVRPDDARALVVLASSYWLTGRGPEVVGELASRALAADPANRGAWHLWSLSESDPRLRMDRWLQVTRRFPDDDLAKANLADSAASLASAENDAVALAIAIDNYQSLLAAARQDDQREALEKALGVLRAWKL